MMTVAAIREFLARLPADQFVSVDVLTPDGGRTIGDLVELRVDFGSQINEPNTPLNSKPYRVRAPNGLNRITFRVRVS